MTSDPIPDDIQQAFSGAGTRLDAFRNHLIWYDEIGSTNDVAAQMAQRDAPEGTVVAANAQSAGRGRMGRTWASPPGAGLYVSLIVRPPEEAVPLLTIAAGVAVADGIRAATGLDAGVKWPNDVYAGTRKLAGILAEAGSTGGGLEHRLDYVVLGFGINLLTAAYPPDIASRATSIQDELGRAPDRGIVLAECLAAFANRYAALCDRRPGEIIAAWRARARSHMGRQVEWDAAASTRRGTAHDIDEEGALLVRADGELVRVISGEVRWL